MGILDYLTGNNGGASPFSALYPSPLLSPDQDAAAKAAAAYGILGMDPSTLPAVMPTAAKANPFGDPSNLSVAPGAPQAGSTGFGAGAAPFGFAGPGSNIVAPSQIAAPAPIPLPVPRPAAADAPPAVATDVSSQNRPAPAPGAPLAAPVAAEDDGPTAPVNAPAPAAPALAPFSLGGGLNDFGDRLTAAGQSFANSKGLIPKLFNAGTSLVTGQRSDAAGQAANATAQALVSKGVPLADVKAAMVNPQLMLSLINQYYGKEKYSVVQTGQNADGDHQFSVFNTNDGTLKPIAADKSELGGTVVGPNGQAITIPAGVNRKEFIKKVTDSAADAATGKMTEAQAKASSFASRMDQAEASMSKLQNQGLNFTARALDALPGGVGNYGQSKEYQQYKQAQSAFITALLRQESGAAINKSEFTRYEAELFPQPGDDPSVVQQKAQMRAAAVQQMRRAAGPGYQSAPQPAASGKTSSGITWSVE